MKVAIRFLKHDPKTLNARVTVIDCKGFYTTLIFATSDDYPSNPGFTLSKRQVDTVVKEFTNTLDAQEWAVMQIAALRKAFHKWNQDALTEFYEVTI